jgi:NAD(P)-dependent dehydrogenase (short-subunit alcohol dehydrogenase family)
MTEQVAVITGGNAGIGKETAVALARAGWRVYITARDPARGADALEDIRTRSTSEHVEVLPLDLADLASVRAFPDLLAEQTDQLDVLVNNAGLVLQDRRVTTDGFEQTFGVNHLGHFLLTDLLLDRLRANPNGSRVVVVSSHAHKMARRGLDFDDLQTEHRRYRGFAAYSRSKLANILFTRELARRLDGANIIVNAVHPGYVDSRFGRDGDTRPWYEVLSRVGSVMAITPEAGAQTSVYLASSPDVDGITGEYFYKGRPAKVSSAALDDVAATRLWSASEILVGI